MQGSIPLHLAAQSGHTAVASLLLSKSASQIHVKDRRGRTGLHLAAAQGHIDMVSLLLGQGADINCFDKVELTLTSSNVLYCSSKTLKNTEVTQKYFKIYA